MLAKYDKSMSQQHILACFVFIMSVGSVPVYADYEDQAYSYYDEATKYLNGLVGNMDVEIAENPLGTTNEEVQDVADKGSKTGKELIDLVVAFHEFIKSVIKASTPEGVAS